MEGMWTTEFAIVRPYIAKTCRLFSPNTRLGQRSLQIVHKASSPYTTKRWYSDNGGALQDDFDTEQEREIFDKLNKALSPSGLHVHDISGGCGTMYKINIVSRQFNNLSVIKQHKLVNEVLRDDIPQWHGLQLITKRET